MAYTFVGYPMSAGAPIQGVEALTNNVAATNGARQGIMLYATTAGTCTFTFADASTATINLALGTNILPFACTKYAVGTAVVANAYNTITTS